MPINIAKVKQKKTQAARRKQQIFNRDGNKCVACGTTEELTIDHIVPKTWGGNWRPSNLQTLCQRCNAIKGQWVIDFRGLHREGKTKAQFQMAMIVQAILLKYIYEQAS